MTASCATSRFSALHAFAPERADRRFKWMVGLSVAVHAALFGALLAAPALLGRRGLADLGPVIEVALVSLPPAASAAAPVTPAPVPAMPEGPPAAASGAPPAKAKSVGAVKADVLYLKRKAREAELARLSRQDESRADREASERDRRRRALEEKLSVLKQGGAAVAKDAPGKGESVDEISRRIAASAKAGREQAALAAAGGIAGREADSYRAQVQSRVGTQWRVPPNLARAAELSAVIRFEIAGDGTVLKVSLERGSGNSAFDDAVLRAAREVSSLGAPPPGFPHGFDVRFNNREMGKGVGR